MNTKLEIHKMAAEMADRVSSRRMVANGFFLTLNTTLTSILAFMYTELAINKRADRATAGIGSTIIYTLDVTNYGPDVATDVTVIDTLPEGLQLVSAQPAQGSCSTNGQQLTCHLGTLNDGESTHITVTAKANRVGSLVNRATVASNEYDPVPANNASEAVVTILPLAPDTGVGRMAYGGLIVVVSSILVMIGSQIYRRRHQA